MEEILPVCFLPASIAYKGGMFLLVSLYPSGIFPPSYSVIVDDIRDVLEEGGAGRSPESLPFRIFGEFVGIVSSEQFAVFFGSVRDSVVCFVSGFVDVAREDAAIVDIGETYLETAQPCYEFAVGCGFRRGEVFFNIVRVDA